MRFARAILLPAVMLSALLLPAACQMDAEDLVPVELRGRWVAQGGAHTGLSFRIGCRDVVIEGADDSFVGHEIRNVHITAAEDADRFDIVMTAAGETDHFRVRRPHGEADALLLDRVTGTRWLRDRSDLTAVSCSTAAVPGKTLP